MRFAYAVFASLLAATSAAAATAPKTSICIDPHWSYQARWLKGNTIVAKQTLGHDHRELKIETTCIGLDNPDRIRLGTRFHCIGMGDEVVATKIDGHTQRCRISHVEPYIPDPAPVQN